MFNRLKDLYTTYQSNKEFKTLLKNHIINDYKIDKGVVDVFGDVQFYGRASSLNNENGIIPIKFGKIDGFFDCSFFDFENKLLNIETQHVVFSSSFDSIISN